MDWNKRGRLHMKVERVRWLYNPQGLSPFFCERLRGWPLKSLIYIPILFLCFFVSVFLLLDHTFTLISCWSLHYSTVGGFAVWWILITLGSLVYIYYYSMATPTPASKRPRFSLLLWFLMIIGILSLLLLPLSAHHHHSSSDHSTNAPASSTMQLHPSRGLITPNHSTNANPQFEAAAHNVPSGPNPESN